MANFESGVKRFIKACAVVEVNFPVDWRDNAEIACKHCPQYVRTAQMCGLNKAVVNYPEKYVGAECPLEIVEEEVKEDV